jgi:hypothetical protein
MEETILNITKLNITDQQLLAIIVDTMKTGDAGHYEKLAQIFHKRAEMIHIINDLVS